MGLQSTTYTASEGDEVTTAVCVQLTGLSRNTLGETLVIILTTTDGTASKKHYTWTKHYRAIGSGAAGIAHFCRQGGQGP